MAAVGLVTGACQNRSAPAENGDGPELRTVQVGLPVAAATFLPLYLAVEDGLFADEGLDVDLVTFRGGSDLVRAVVAGSVDIGVTSLAGVTVGISAGQPLKAFWAGYNIPAFHWYAVPEIQTLEDARGKRFGVTRYGSSTDFLTRYILARRGLDPDEDVHIIQGGDSPSRLAAMQAGQLDVNIFNPPETFIAEERGFAHLLSQRSLADDYPFHVFFSTEQFISEHPRTLTALLRAHVRAVRLAKSDKARALESLSARMGPEYAERTYDDFIPYIHEDGRLPSERGLEVFFEMGVQAGRFDEIWPLEKFWSSSYIDSFAEWRPE
jgi:NitT/TauT family transport system substrate-binding protein